MKIEKHKKRDGGSFLSKSAYKFVSNRIIYTALILFIVSFVYSLFLTSDVPFFWDDHFLNDDYNGKTISDLGMELTKIDYGDIASTPRTFFAIFFKIVFYLFGYDIILLRAAKSFVFSSLIVLLFYFFYRYLKDYALAAAYSFFMTFSFALYSRLIPYDDPYLLSELFKLAAFYLFIKDFTKEKTFILNQILIAFFAFFAMRTYQVAYSIPLVFAMFILLMGFKHIKRYMVLVILLLATNLPYGNLFTGSGGSPAYQLSFTIIKKFLFENSLGYITSPAINLGDLYYMPLISVITFFCFWLFVSLLIIYLLRKKFSKMFPSCFSQSKKNEKDPDSYRTISLFLLAWIVAEIPLWVILPDDAIRYVSSVLIPLMMLYFILVRKTLNLFKKRSRNIAFVLIIIIISFACMTNIVYAAVFRAGWGSSFIGMEKTTSYIENERKNDSIVLYYSQSVAAEYVPVRIIKPSKNLNRTYHVIQEGIEYRQIRAFNGFSSQNLKNLSQNYNEVYIIKRVTGFSGHEIPPIDFDSYPDLKLLTIIKGDTPSLFDKMAYSTVKLLKVNYTPQIFYVYKYIK